MNLEDLADYCRTLPGTTEDIKWGNDLVFSVGEKMYCAFGWQGDRLFGVSFKVPDERFLEFTDRPQFIPAPYLARARWVTATDGSGLSVDEMRDNILVSHRLVLSRLTKKKQAAILGQG